MSQDPENREVLGAEGEAAPEEVHEDLEVLATRVVQEAEKKTEELAGAGEATAEEIAAKFDEEVDSETKKALAVIAEKGSRLGRKLVEVVSKVTPVLEKMRDYPEVKLSTGKIRKLFLSGKHREAFSLYIEKYPKISSYIKRFPKTELALESNYLPVFLSRSLIEAYNKDESDLSGLIEFYEWLSQQLVGKDFFDEQMYFLKKELYQRAFNKVIKDNPELGQNSNYEERREKVRQMLMDKAPGAFLTLANEWRTGGTPPMDKGKMLEVAEKVAKSGVDIDSLSFLSPVSELPEDTPPSVREKILESFLKPGYNGHDERSRLYLLFSNLEFFPSFDNLPEAERKKIAEKANTDFLYDDNFRKGIVYGLKNSLFRSEWFPESFRVKLVGTILSRDKDLTEINQQDLRIFNISPEGLQAVFLEFLERTLFVNRGDIFGQKSEKIVEILGVKPNPETLKKIILFFVEKQNNYDSRVSGLLKKISGEEDLSQVFAGVNFTTAEAEKIFRSASTSLFPELTKVLRAFPSDEILKDKIDLIYTGMGGYTKIALEFFESIYGSREKAVAELRRIFLGTPKLFEFFERCYSEQEAKLMLEVYGCPPYAGRVVFKRSAESGDLKKAFAIAAIFKPDGQNNDDFIKGLELTSEELQKIYKINCRELDQLVILIDLLELPPTAETVANIFLDLANSQEQSNLIKFLDLCKERGWDFVNPLKEVYVKIVVNLNLPELAREIATITEVPIDWQKVGAVLSAQKSPSEIVLITERVPEINETTVPWLKSLKSLRKVQDMSERQEHCPWRQELDPLVSVAVKDGVLSPEKTEDGEILLSFVKEFGTYNLPILFKVFADLKRAKSLTDLKDENLELLKEALGNRILKLSPEAVIDELRKFRRNFQAELLRDKIPDRIESRLGAEIFNALRGSTRWHHGDSVPELVAVWRQTAETKPEVTACPEGYEEKEVEVPIVSRRVATEAKPEVEEAEQKILGNKELLKVYGDFLQVFKAGNEIGEPREWWEKTKVLLVKSLEEKIILAEAKLAKVTAEKARMGIEKNIEQARDLINKIQSCILDSSDEAGVVALMEKLATWETGSEEVKEALHVLSAYHLKSISSEGWQTTFEQLSSGPEIPGPEEIKKLADFYLNYLKEHYLNENQDNHVSYHLPFSPALRRVLDSYWQTKGDIRKNILLQSSEKLHSLAAGSGTVSDKKQKISFVPSRGLLRIFSGDLGDACYTSKHRQLANGEVPGITAIVLATNRGQITERLAGSVLFIETQTPQGERVLVVRANNPRENLLGKVDSTALITEIIQYAQETAARRGIKKVGVPLDNASQSCSNRPAVAEYYRNNFSDAGPMDLVNEPETNFNGYGIYSSSGPHKVVEISS